MLMLANMKEWEKLKVILSHSEGMFNTFTEVYVYMTHGYKRDTKLFSSCVSLSVTHVSSSGCQRLQEVIVSLDGNETAVLLSVTESTQKKKS